MAMRYISKSSFVGLLLVVLLGVGFLVTAAGTPFTGATEGSRINEKHGGSKQHGKTMLSVNGDGAERQTSRSGEVLAFRLVDELSSARYKGPDPAEAYRSLKRHWRKMLDPHTDLSADKVHFRLKTAFRKPDVKNYLKYGSLTRMYRERLGSGERRWSRTDGVYESRTALFSPLAARKKLASEVVSHRKKKRGEREGRESAEVNESDRKNDNSKPWGDSPMGSCFEFGFDLPLKSVLEFGVAVLPRHEKERAPVWFVIEIESGDEVETVWRQEVKPDRFMTWYPDQLALWRWGGQRVTLRFKVYGVNGGGLWMDPKIWRPGVRGGDNLLVILVDTLRPDGVRALEGEHAVTPNMDRLVKEGVKFTNYYSNGSFTRNSLIAKFASNYASSVGLEANRFAFRGGTKEKFYGLKVPLFPLHLEKNGFQVFTVMNNFFSFPYVNVGVDLGFSNFTDIRHKSDDSRAMTRTAVRFLRNNRNRRFFLFVHYETLHGYNKDTKKHAREFALPEGVEMNPYMRAYLSIAKEMDEEVGLIMKALEDLGLEENTLVVLTSDHGEVFHEEHAHQVPYYNMNMLHQHARSIWDEVLRVPMVWRHKGKLPPDKEVKEIVRGIDLAPTLLDYLGEDKMEPTAGKSALSFLPGRENAESGTREGGDKINNRNVYAEGFHIKSLRKGRYKYILRDYATRVFVHKGRQYDRLEQLFDLEDDPLEIHDISRERPEVVQDLRETMLNVQRESLYANLLREHSGEGEESRGMGGYHLRLCAGSSSKRLIGSIALNCEAGEILVQGVKGDVRVRPSEDGRAGVYIDMRAKDDCVGLDWSSQPICGSELELELDGRRLRGRDYRAGPFGVALLRRPEVSLSEASKLESTVFPFGLSPANPGVFVWQTPFRGAAWLDTESSQRSEASDAMMQMNLQQAGYVHTTGGR